LWLGEADSTNTVAASFADDPANEGLVVLADYQTAGRGRFQRRWLSPPGQGVLLSVLLFPPPELRLPSVLTPLAAVAVCETIYAATQRQARIKWPNDVLVNGRKVCGMLVEQGCGTVIGIGLNVSTPAEVFAAHGLTDAAALAHFTDRPLRRDQVAEMLIRQLDEAYELLLAGDAADLEARWCWHTGLLGKQVYLETRQASYVGRIRDLTLREIRLESLDGRLCRFVPETIDHITPLPE